MQYDSTCRCRCTSFKHCCTLVLSAFSSSKYMEHGCGSCLSPRSARVSEHASAGGFGFHAEQRESATLQISVSAAFPASTNASDPGFNFPLKAIEYSLCKSGQFFNRTQPCRWTVPLLWYSSRYQVHSARMPHMLLTYASIFIDT